MFPPNNNEGQVENERDLFDLEDKPEDKVEEKEYDEVLEEDDKEIDEEQAEEKDEDKVEDDEPKEEEVDEEEEQFADDNVYQALKKVDPTIFKKVPELKHILFREAQLTNIFPSVKAAQQAAELASDFISYQNDMVSGKAETLVTALGKTDGKALEKFAANFIPAVQKHSNDLYLQLIFPELKKLFRVASKANDERISKAAHNLHYFVFGDMNLDAEAGLKPTKVDEEEDRITKRERELNERQYKSFYNDVVSLGENKVKRHINAGFKDMGLSELLQNSLTDEVFRRIENVITKDARHMGNINHLWLRAQSDGFTSQWKDRIINTYLSRAKLLIPKMRQQVLSEAKVARANTSTDEGKKVRRIPSTSGIATRGMKIDKNKIDWSDPEVERKMLNGEIPMKRS